MASGTGPSSQEDEPISSINVTPLVDVVLVLLVIFMITAPVIYQSAIKVQLPKARTGENTQESRLTFTVSRDTSVSWNGEKMEWAAMEGKLRSLVGTLSEQTAVISADDAAPHGAVIRLMDILRDVGLTHFALNVEAVPAPMKK